MNGGPDHHHHSQNDIPLLELRQLKVISVLGRGAKGVVFLVQPDQQQSTNNEFLALKAISKASIQNSKVDNNGDLNENRRICFEQEVLRSFRHPLLPRLRGVLSTDEIIGYAIDYCPGRDLNSLRNNQTEKMFSDDIIRFYAAELILALEYLHGLGIVYRDLKPENVVIQENGHLMLVDFDLSTKLPPKSPEPRRPIVKSVSKSAPIKKKRFPSFQRCWNSGISPEDSAPLPEIGVDSASFESDSAAKSKSFVGTEDYVAPEIILGKGHDFAVDCWCLGVMLYEMLYGTTPFRGSNRKETFHRILKKSPELTGEPTPLRDLIAKLLEKDPMLRISLEGIKGHDFFRGVDWDLIWQIERPPFIPLLPEDEDTLGNKEIDVESFVQEAFGSKSNEENINNGVWVEAVNLRSQSDKFFTIF
ncbi:serine/threonine-protein kinase OXI1-like [Cornus florida]|uniref:serine/threonine-protein kinase OXI1-like n=1 Tax=Cornus florida TaxID=4283 RepID=UPI00289863D2|nr:serine/threonine-protein kinase OXI1-like [Cornus florida]